MRGLAHELPEPALRWDAGRIHDHVYREYLLAADAKLAELATTTKSTGESAKKAAGAMNDFGSGTDEAGKAAKRERKV